MGEDLKQNIESQQTQDEVHEERPVWEEFLGGETNEAGEYKEPTTQQKEKLQKRLKRLAEIFDGSDFPWVLDGGTNISLYGDKQIRDHKDLDIGILQNDIKRINTLLEANGFAIFFSFEESGRRLMRKLTKEEINNPQEILFEGYLTIGKVDEQGKTERSTNEPCNFMDLHVHQQDGQGNVLGFTGVKIPEKYFAPFKKEMPDESIINLSQPIMVAYYKIHGNRDYDITDLKKLKPHLNQESIFNLKQILDKEVEQIKDAIEKKVKQIWDTLSPIIEFTRDPQVIKNAILSDSDIQKRREDKRVLDYIEQITNLILEKPGLSFEDFKNKSLEILNPNQMFAEKIKILEE